MSGRGVGLDAARASLLAAGGALNVASVVGKGTRWTVRLPAVPLTIAGLVIRATSVPFPVVLDGSWRLDDTASPARTLDLAAELGIGRGESGTSVRFSRGTDVIAIPCDGPPVAQTVRRLVGAPASALAEVIAIDASEDLLIRPERL